MYRRNPLLERINTLASINVLQPVTIADLSRALTRRVQRNVLPTILSELVRDGLVARESTHYRVTTRGMSLLSSRHVSTARDIARMKYLLATSKQRGGDSLGR